MPGIPTVYLTSYELARKRRGVGPGPLVQVSNLAPACFRGERCELLIPPWSWVQKAKQNPEAHWEGFARAYRERLDGLFETGDVYKLEPLLDREPTFLCWEAPGHRCHRLIVAEFLAELGYPVFLDGREFRHG